MADIIILSLVFPPDNVSTAQLMGDLAEDLQRRGHRVTVLTSLPHYHRDTGSDVVRLMKRRWGGLLRETSYKGVRVLHAWMPAKGRRVLYRAFTWLNFHLWSTVAGWICIPRADIVLSPSPPLTIGISAWLIARRHGAKFVYIVQEVYPDVAVNLGALREGWIVRRLRDLELWVYGKAAAVSVISVRMRSTLVAKGVPNAKLAVVPNFADTNGFKPGQKDNDFSRAHGLAEKFVVSYAGNMGKPQHLETLLHAASNLVHRTDIQFLLLGGGSEVEKLKRLCVDLGLKNVTFLGQQPYGVMPNAYAATDISYVPQAIGTSNDGIPSKVYRIMAMACPVIACTDDGSDLAVLIAEAKCGQVVTSYDPIELSRMIASAAANPEQWRKMGEHGRRHVLENYERSRVVDQYERLIEGVLAT
jgi:colanic acid biosynthesis glycosyl transferase WcaI